MAQYKSVPDPTPADIAGATSSKGWTSTDITITKYADGSFTVDFPADLSAAEEDAVKALVPGIWQGKVT